MLSPKFSMWLNAAIAVLAAVSSGVIGLTGVMAEGPAHVAASWATFIVAVYGVANAALHGVSSPAAGPLSPPSNPSEGAGKTLGMFWPAVLLAGALAASLIAPGAQAASTVASKPGEHKMMLASPNDLMKKLQAVTLDDLRYADNIAQAHGNVIAHQCWAAWIDIIETDQKANLGPDGKPLDLPALHLITDLQKLLDLHNSLAPDGKFGMACAPLASKMKMNLLQMVTGVIAGTVTFPLLFP